MADYLHQAGLDAVVYEAGDDVGGQVRIDLVEGFGLDRGLPRRFLSSSLLRDRGQTEFVGGAVDQGEVVARQRLVPPDGRMRPCPPRVMTSEKTFKGGTRVTEAAFHDELELLLREDSGLQNQLTRPDAAAGASSA